MEVKVTLMQLTVLVLMALAAAAADQALPGCPKKCGSVSVPYPFGIGVSSVSGEKCFLEDALELTCQNSTLLHGGSGNVEILNIALGGKMDMLFSVSTVCRNGSERVPTEGEEIGLRSPGFAISSKDNTFVSVGCDTYGYFNSYVNGTKSSTGCLTTCGSKESMNSMQQRGGNCTGIGCCHVDIPPKMQNISFQTFSFNNFESSSDFSNCSYSFVVENGNYTFSLDHLNGLPFRKTSLVVDWSVGNVTCNVSKRSVDYACKRNSDCMGSNTGYGYRCACKAGFEGNPYLPTGCQDILECATGRHNCTCEQDCVETSGSFKCVPRKGKNKNRTNKGGQCDKNQRNDTSNKNNKHRKNKSAKAGIGFGVGAGAIVLSVGTSGIYLDYQKRKASKLKKMFFQQNGGMILDQQQPPPGEDSSQSPTIFTSDELKKATNNFNKNSIIGKRGFGTAFKGVLSNNKTVAIKKSRRVPQSRVKQFINEVLSLSQINHKNVVKFLGCCLETDVPLMIYEFVNKGTFFDYLHNKSEADNVSWETYLRIATETAEALSYLHSKKNYRHTYPIKTSNILLDDTYTAKVSEVGASRLVALDQTDLVTIVQGTVGYLDPEYMQTSQLTKKSDVYSFGVVLVEILTGEKPFCFDRPEEKRSLIMHFLSYLREGRLVEVIQMDIWDDGNNELEIKEVANLAAKCLKLRGRQRPSMEYVAMELKRIQQMGKDPLTNESENVEETSMIEDEGISEIEDE
ncbi:wall-associated receptor kinase 2 [Cajanus cajan]|uniref:wall-associated receptor kinase 2 n=1 Tax=Cajanus cajan TaxID=3821 RepID=UPI00098DC16C|nr:wall-associated receptor kinase 2 [Cajanus cajan]